MYKFADVYRGLYHEAIRGAERYYESTDYGDELAWAAIWLFKATRDTKYFDDAVHHYQHFHLKERPNAFFYNKKVAGIQVKFFIYILFCSKINIKRVPMYLREENLEVIRKGKEMRAHISKTEVQKYERD